MHTLGVVIIAVVGALVWLAAALPLLIAGARWQTPWARVTHLVATVAILGALAFGIYQLVNAIPDQKCGPADQSSGCRYRDLG